MAIVFASNLEGEATDLTNIDLPGLQNQLIEAVAAANPNTIVVLNTGSAITMRWLGQVAGVLEAWYPGQQDGVSIASLLFGDANPSGKLPVTFPKSLADVPPSTPAQWPGTNGQVQYSEGLDVGYRWCDAKNVTPLFPFGYGLSYTTFSSSNENLSAASGSPSAPVTATANVTNTGSRAGSEVAQLYLTDPVNVTASKFSASNSVGTETTTDTTGGQDVGWINNSSWLAYSGVNFGSGLNTVTARIASPLAQSASNGEIQFRVDSLTAAPFATIPVTDTGGWQTWVTTPAVTSSPVPGGTHTLYATFTSGQSGNFVNVNDFTFSGG